MNVLFMTIPAVALGGQVPPFINNRVDGEKMKLFLALVFIFVGSLLLWLAPWNILSTEALFFHRGIIPRGELLASRTHFETH